MEYYWLLKLTYFYLFTDQRLCFITKSICILSSVSKFYLVIYEIVKSQKVFNPWFDEINGF